MESIKKVTVKEAMDLLDAARKNAKDVYKQYMMSKKSQDNQEPRVCFRPEDGPQVSVQELEANISKAKIYLDESIFICHPGTIYEVPGFLVAVWYRDEDDEVVLDIFDITDGKIKTVTAYDFEESELVCEFLNRYDNANLKY